LRDLLHGLQIGFWNIFICCIIKIIFCNTSPWNNPSLPVLQREFDLAYPLPHYQLHMDDAVVIPVTTFFLDAHCSFLTALKTNRDIGALQNQIGEEALKAVTEFLPTQYNKRTLDSKREKAGYIAKLLESTQHPFIWEYFQPGTIPIPRGEELYYDEVSSDLRCCCTVYPR
jgi:hypothetical protein